MSIFRFELLDLPPEAEALPGRGARVPRARRWATGRRVQRGALLGRPRPRVQPQGRRARLDRHDVAEAYGGHERSALERYVVLEEMLAAGRAGRRALGGGPPERAAAPALRHRGAAAALPAADRARRARVRHRHERAGLGLGPRARSAPAPSARTAATSSTAPRCGRATPTSRDYMIALFRTAGRARQEARGALAVPRRPQDAGDHHPADRRPRRRAPLQRGASSRTPSCPTTCGSATRARAGSR